MKILALFPFWTYNTFLKIVYPTTNNKAFCVFIEKKEKAFGIVFINFH